MIHGRLDLSRWISEFPLSGLRAEARDFVIRRRQELPKQYADDAAVAAHIQLMYPKWQIVVGPAAVAINEQLRQEAVVGGEVPSTRVPTDLAVWARGELAERAVTKIGGLPYRPAGLPWPIGDTGRPLRFVGQLSFVDSRDIVPSLPGDVLLVFGDDDALLGEPHRLAFEWWPLTSGPLTSEAPQTDAPLSPFHAVLHRTEDWDTTVFEGTKIGGVPSFIQGEPVGFGRFIGSIGSISVSPRARHPFINVAEPRGWSDDGDLKIGDMGSLYVFLGSGGQVRAFSQCY